MVKEERRRLARAVLLHTQRQRTLTSNPVPPPPHTVTPTATTYQLLGRTQLRGLLTPTAKRLSGTLFQPYEQDPGGIVHYLFKQHLQRVWHRVMQGLHHNRMTGAEVYRHIDASIAPHLQTEAFRARTLFLNHYHQKQCPIPASEMWYGRLRTFLQLLQPGMVYGRTAVYLLYTVSAELTRFDITRASQLPTRGKVLSLYQFHLILAAYLSING